MVRPPMITAVPHLLLYSPFLSLFFYFYFMFYFIYLFIYFFSPFPSTRRILSAAGMNSVERSPPKKKKRKKNHYGALFESDIRGFCYRWSCARMPKPVKDILSMTQAPYKYALQI